MTELLHHSLTELAGLIRRREVSPVEIVTRLLEQIEETNPRLNAIVTIAPDLLERARAAEQSVMNGESLGPLHGVPVTIKDTIETAGLRTTSGSKRRADHVPVNDAPAVRRLRQAGAIILGKTNTSELAFGLDAENPLFGRTSNPLDFSRTSGGSSGGEAAAIASFMSFGGLGSDLMGSIRIPADFCGIYGLKPTIGRVPIDGQFPAATGPYSLGEMIGPLARSVADLELLFNVIAGVIGPRSPLAPNLPSVDEPGLRGTRVVVYADDECSPVTPETISAVQAAAKILKDAGLEIVEELPPGISRGPELWTDLFAHGGQGILRALYAGHEGDGGGLVRAMLKKPDGNSQSLEDFIDAWRERDQLRATLVEYMESAPLLLCPVGAVPAFPHGTRRVEVAGRSLTIFEAFSYCQPFNVYGLPVACVPAGNSPEGLPIGVQIVGRPFAEAEVLAAARIIEAASATKSTTDQHA